MRWILTPSSYGRRPREAPRRVGARLASVVLLALLLIGSRLALAAHAHQHALDSGNPDCELCEHAHGATAAPAPDEPALGAAIARNADVHVAPVDAPTRPASAYHSRAPPDHARRRAT